MALPRPTLTVYETLSPAEQHVVHHMQDAARAAMRAEGYKPRNDDAAAYLDEGCAMLIVASRPAPETPNDREALRLQMERATQMEALASWRERGVL